ncbi:MAG: HU family DNA-binding protein [Myxococcota bacterium]
MNKSDLARLLAERRGIHQRKADAIVNVVFDAMGEALKRKERIEIRGFGSFISKHYKAYMGRNPKTGEQIDVPAKWMPYFKVGKDLKRKINDGDAAPEKEALAAPQERALSE